MKEKDSFQKDLDTEAKFGNYLDKLYPQIKGLDKKFTFLRKDDLESQYAGIDLILKDKESGEERYIDEKAQLYYLNKSLNTFTFEISYLKHGVWKKGWFYDEKKLTQTYFLFTSIETNDQNEFINCRFIIINRKYLQEFLEEAGLTQEKTFAYEKLFREDKKKYNGNQVVFELDSSFATFHCSFANLKEEPINLKIKLNAVLEHGLGYEFLSCSIRK
jgi:hypothetical protein